MIESTLIARSTRVIASASVVRDAVDDRQQPDDAALDEADPRRRQRHRGEQRRGEGHEERAADPEVDVRQPERLDDEVQAHRLGRPDEAGEDDEARQRAQADRARTRPPRTGRRTRGSGAAAGAW